MDNFMDKLSKRFNAGEIIHANGEAEARETERLRQQMAQYDQILQEVRRLNLKTAEMSEQVSQMLASGIEQFESYAQENHTRELEADRQEAQNAQQTDDLEEMKALLARQTDDLEEAKASLVRQTDDLEETKALLAQLKNSVSDEVENKLSGVALRIDNSEASVTKEVSDASYRVEASISQLGEDVAVTGRAVESQLRELQQSLAQTIAENTSDSDLSQQLSEALAQSDKALEESAKQIKEMIVNLRLYQDEVRKAIEDYVHKEDVKVYRNVQANVAEQLTNRFRDMTDRMDELEKEVRKNKGTKLLLVLTILLAGAGVALQVVSLLGIL